MFLPTKVLINLRNFLHSLTVFSSLRFSTSLFYFLLFISWINVSPNININSFFILIVKCLINNFSFFQFSCLFLLIWSSTTKLLQCFHRLFFCHPELFPEVYPGNSHSYYSRDVHYHLSVFQFSFFCFSCFNHL